MGKRNKIYEGKLYYLTFTVVDWVDIFTRPVYKHIIIDSLEYCQKNKGLFICGWVLMSNHLHIIAGAKDGFNLSEILRDFKKFTSKKLLKMILENPQESRKEWLKMIFEYHAKFNKRSGDMQFWTHENHAIELYRTEMIESRINYIHENPVRAGIVEKPEDYICSSAKNYAGL